MKKFDISNFLYRSLLEQNGEDPNAQNQQQPQVQVPAQQQTPQQNKTSGANEAFRSLQGQMIAGVEFAPNGSSGGTIKIKVKNSYVPFTISWANQTITVTDLQGNSMVLGENNQ